MMIAVLAAVDVALWDIKGKAENKPIYELLGGVSGAPIVPYSSLYSRSARRSRRRSRGTRTRWRSHASSASER